MLIFNDENVSNDYYHEPEMEIFFYYKVYKRLQSSYFKEEHFLNYLNQLAIP